MIAQESPSPRSESRRTRGAGFPVISVEPAVEIVIAAANHGWEHSAAAIAQYAGHSAANSGPFRSKLAALKQYGLIKQEDDRIALDQSLVKRLAFPESEDELRSAMREAFLHCDLFRQTYEAQAKGIDLALARVASFAVNNLAVAAHARDSFARVFAESAVAVGLADHVADGVIKLRGSAGPARSSFFDAIFPNPFQAGRSAEAVLAPIDGSSSDAAATQAAKQSASTNVRQTWTVAGGAVTFEASTDRAIPAQSYATMGQIFEAIEQLVRELQGADSSATE